MKFRYIIILGIILLAGCSKEEGKLTPTEGSENIYNLPQGNHDYDDEIMYLYEKYGFFTLYKFTKQDIFWNNTSWTEYISNTQAGNNYVGGVPADTNYVQKQLDMCKELFLEHYPDSLIQRMPLKLLLCSDIGQRYGYYNASYKYMYDTLRLQAIKGYDHIAVNGGSAEIDTMQPLIKMDFQRVVNGIYLNHLYNQGVFFIPQDFTKETSSYSTVPTTEAKANEIGLLTRDRIVTGNVQQSQINDFLSYLEMVVTPIDILESKIPGDFPYRGYLLTDKKDTKGVIRKKYEVLMKFFKEQYGINTDEFRKPSIQ